MSISKRFGKYPDKLTVDLVLALNRFQVDGALAATETVATVVAQVAIAIANRDRSTAIATRGIALESSELAVA